MVGIYLVPRQRRVNYTRSPSFAGGKEMQKRQRFPPGDVISARVVRCRDRVHPKRRFTRAKRACRSGKPDGLTETKPVRISDARIESDFGQKGESILDLTRQGDRRGQEDSNFSPRWHCLGGEISFFTLLIRGFMHLRVPVLKKAFNFQTA